MVIVKVFCFFDKSGICCVGNISHSHYPVLSDHTGDDDRVTRTRTAALPRSARPALPVGQRPCPAAAAPAAPADLERDRRAAPYGRARRLHRRLRDRLHRQRRRRPRTGPQTPGQTPPPARGGAPDRLDGRALRGRRYKVCMLL